MATKWLARFTVGFVFINVGATILIIIVLLACTGKENMHPAGYDPVFILTRSYRRVLIHGHRYVFGSAGIINQTGLGGAHGWNTGLAFLFGLLSVQWTVGLPVVLPSLIFLA